MGHRPCNPLSKQKGTQHLPQGPLPGTLTIGYSLSCPRSTCTDLIPPPSHPKGRKPQTAQYPQVCVPDQSHTPAWRGRAGRRGFPLLGPVSHKSVPRYPELASAPHVRAGKLGPQAWQRSGAPPTALGLPALPPRAEFQLPQWRLAAERSSLHIKVHLPSPRTAQGRDESATRPAEPSSHPSSTFCGSLIHSLPHEAEHVAPHTSVTPIPEQHLARAGERKGSVPGAKLGGINSFPGGHL